MPNNDKRSVLGRRLVVGHRILDPDAEVRLLPPQYREQGLGNREKGNKVKNGLWGVVCGCEKRIFKHPDQ
jgi:hypothetical protein